MRVKPVKRKRISPADAPRPEQMVASGKAFSIVGLGASAGGLEALEEFFGHLPAESGAAFVVVTHQHAGHTSLLPELLRKRATMPVMEATDGLRVRPNCIYVARPEGYLAILNGKLHLMETKEPPGVRLPIDYFFRSLAEDQREHAVGIILSGTASDGTLGIKAIKGATGMTMAQEPESAKYPGMPRSAIATGLVDFVLPASRLPQRLTAYAQGPYLTSPLGAEHGAAMPLPEPMQKIILLLRSRGGHDFSGYKPATLRRRIERRMNIHQVKGPLEYLRILQDNPHELELLFRELLIGVTSFFRDREAFHALGKSALPELLEAQPDEGMMRVWVPACSTGEEAYSLAILLHELAAKLKKRVGFQIFGTDLDSLAINVARAGVYPDGIAGDLTREQLARFFHKEDDHFRIGKMIREQVIFAPQNVIQDPPFTKLDLISCRNLLIYLDAARQRRLLATFHYALKPNGLLFLGTCESVGELSEHFVVVDKKFKIFRRAAGAPPPLMPPDLAHDSPTAADGRTRVDEAFAPVPETQAPAVFEKLLLNRFAPASVIVNEKGDIRYIHGRTGHYLEPAPGQPRQNVLEMAREGLQLTLSAALRRAATQEGEVLRPAVRMKANGGFALVDVSVSRIAEPEAVRGLLLVAFRPSPAPAASRAGGKKIKPAAGPPSRMKELEQDLLLTQESLRGTIEEWQTSSEELKSSNEELQSTNEELQSTNEELETSKEEMQSLNEELQTVNAQLQSKIEAYVEASDDMHNLLNSTAIATVFLDGELKIRRYTEEARLIFNLIPGDVGRPISNLAANLQYDQLVADAKEVLRTLAPCEREVPVKDGSWRLARIRPYRTTDNVIDGLVLTLMDITRGKLAEQAAEKGRIFADSVVETVREPLLVLDHELRVVSANQAFCRRFHLKAAEVERHPLDEIADGQWRIPKLLRALKHILTRHATIEDFSVEHEFAGLGRKTLILNARRIQQEAGLPGLILLAMEV